MSNTTKSSRFERGTPQSLLEACGGDVEIRDRVIVYLAQKFGAALIDKINVNELWEALKKMERTDGTE